MNKFSRQILGTHNIDHCARLCHSSTVAGLAACFGSGAMSNTIADIYEHAKSIFIIGSNTTEQHPVFGSIIRQAVRKKGTKLVVADPRKIDIVEFAHLHLQHKPGTDVALINGLMNIIINNNWHDSQFIKGRCEGYEEFLEVVDKYTPQAVEKITSVPVENLKEAAEIIATNSPMAVFWAMGITQHTTGVLNVLSLGNLQMLLGNMGVPGGGVNPLRGQNNVQGACDLGGLPNVFPGYQSVADANIRNKFQKAWQLTDYDNSTPQLFGSEPGLTVTEMIPKAENEEIRALYILAENPVMSDPDSNHTKECLEKCDFVVLQEIFASETAPYADVLLPGITFAEKEGTFTNTERRIQRVRKAITPNGFAKDDWKIISDIANLILAIENKTPTGSHSKWQYTNPSEIMAEISALTPSYAGVTFERLDNGEQLHWPVKGKDHPGTPILHIDSFTRGKGKFHTAEHLEPAELPDDEYPFLLTTGRVLYHWHGGEMSRRSNNLINIYPEALVEICPEDARKLSINPDEKVIIRSRRGTVIAKPTISERVSPGLIFANFHFPEEQNANNLTISALDPIAKIPEYKICAATIEKSA